MKALLLAAVTALLLLTGVKAAPKPEQVAVFGPSPEYPYEARRNEITGKGVVVMYVDSKSGIVTKAVMAQSTGHAILDNAALSAFRRWRFKPGSDSKIKSPVSFSMSSANRLARMGQ